MGNNLTVQIGKEHRMASWPHSLAALERTATEMYSSRAASGPMLHETLIERPLTTEERLWISNRIHELAPFENLLADDHETLLAVGGILAVMQPSPDSETVQGLKAEAYAIAVDDVPTWAVKMAIRRWYRGEVREVLPNANTKFPPAPAELAELARAVNTALRAELYRLRRLFGAVPPRPVTPASKARVEEIMANLSLQRMPVNDAENRDTALPAAT